jgi:anti-sigma factor ChrR (cupin superfamily)
MTSEIDHGRCDQAELVAVYALQALPSSDVPAMETHISTCSICQAELAKLRAVVNSFAWWPTDVLRPSKSLWGRLAQRIAAETGAEPLLPEAREWEEPEWEEPEWEEPAPGIFCKLLATDWERDRVSMLVRLAPGVDYPPHRHAGVEELHLLDGELWIDDRKLYPGDYNRAEPGTGDSRVWSETGCTCVLITSPLDLLD